MKPILLCYFSSVLVLISSCAQLKQGPAGAWQGMDGTDVISIKLSEDGNCLVKKPAQEIAGTWSTIAPGKAVIKSYGMGVFKMRSENEAIYHFNGQDIDLKRVIIVPPPKSAQPIRPAPQPIKPAPQPEPMSAQVPKPIRESYYLNEIP